MNFTDLPCDCPHHAPERCWDSPVTQQDSETKGSKDLRQEVVSPFGQDRLRDLLIPCCVSFLTFNAVYFHVQMLFRREKKEVTYGGRSALQRSGPGALGLLQVGTKHSS